MPSFPIQSKSFLFAGLVPHYLNSSITHVINQHKLPFSLFACLELFGKSQRYSSKGPNRLSNPPGLQLPGNKSLLLIKRMKRNLSTYLTNSYSTSISPNKKSYLKAFTTYAINHKHSQETLLDMLQNEKVVYSLQVCIISYFKSFPSFIKFKKKKKKSISHNVPDAQKMSLEAHLTLPLHFFCKYALLIMFPIIFSHRLSFSFSGLFLGSLPLSMLAPSLPTFHFPCCFTLYFLFLSFTILNLFFRTQKAILKNTPTDHADYKPLSQVLASIEETIFELNTSVSKDNQLLKTLLIQGTLVGNEVPIFSLLRSFLSIPVQRRKEESNLTNRTKTKQNKTKQNQKT